MTDAHIPAWKKIAIKHTSSTKLGEGDDEDVLNVTTHLAGNLLSKSKAGHTVSNKKNLKYKSGETKVQKPSKRVKLPRSERELRSASILRDQLRYLVDFYLDKIAGNSPADVSLPQKVAQLTSVAEYVAAKSSTSSSGVVSAWKFSKQKQNWLLKNLFNMEAIPQEYDVLLIEYVRSLIGHARAIVIERCKKIIAKPEENEKAAEISQNEAGSSPFQNETEESLSVNLPSKSPSSYSQEVILRGQSILKALTPQETSIQ
ncbi:HCL138Cp [Eremothecium sinecaudum]|uniref:HCL138Cp n=1 Tax=Eremothecium sinecaudum TaxID=45286 RepID=A0A120K203_9SACH|nr:HCL138Cp [Eremothecium sinecaudum]AMD20013.1 HCL138Cp [Eremothecium sinecaudum]